MKKALFILLCIVTPSLALAAPRTFAEFADMITNIINGGIGVALIAGIVVYFYGIVGNLANLHEGKTEQLRTQILWGIVALFVMFSVWGILALLRNTLFGNGAFAGSGGSDQVLCTGLDDCTISE